MGRRSARRTGGRHAKNFRDGPPVGNGVPVASGESRNVKAVERVCLTALLRKPLENAPAIGAMIDRQLKISIDPAGSDRQACIAAGVVLKAIGQVTAQENLEAGLVVESSGEKCVVRLIGGDGLEPL